MADATSVPILLDGDTGYGNFNNVRRLVRKLEQRGVAGVCIEDKLFPKTNSFIGDHQPLADVDEFCGKIKAGKDSASRPRLLDRRARRGAHRRAGPRRGAAARRGLPRGRRRRDPDPQQAPDRRRDPRLRRGVGRALRRSSSCRRSTTPTPTDAFREAGISVVIWANHNLRASISAMREVSRRIRDEESLVGVEGAIASVARRLRAGRQLGARRGRAALPAARPRRAARHRHRRLARRRAGPAHRRAAQVHDRHARAAPPPPAVRHAPGVRRRRHHRRARLPEGGDRCPVDRHGRQRRLRDDGRGRVAGVRDRPPAKARAS